MKKKLSIFLAVLAVAFLFVPVSVRAAGDFSESDTADIISQVKQQLSAAFENLDQETAQEVFSFLKEKLREAD